MTSRFVLRAARVRHQSNAAARQSSQIFVVTGGLALTALNVFLPGSPGIFGVSVICGLTVLLGVIVWVLPWDNWHPRCLTAVIPLALLIIGSASFIHFTPLEYGLYFLLLFVWIGLAQGRWVCVAFSPLAAAVYAAPLRNLPEPMSWNQILGSAIVVIPVSVLMGEIIAAKVEAMARAQRESDHRADLLRAVSKACRSISTLDRAAVLAAVADAVAEIGFAASDFNFITACGTRYRVEEARGLPHGYQLDTHPLDGSLTGRVVHERMTIVLGDYSQDIEVNAALETSGFRATIATPIWVAGELVGVLTAASHQQLAFSPQDIEALELLAGQAGRALENARTFQAEVAVRHQLVADSMHDVLTGIGNRRYAMTILDSLRTGDALALIDLDHFKSVNDTYGHAAGDAVLVQLGGFLSAALRDGDDVARFGGEEFLLVLRNAGIEASSILRRLTEDWRALSHRTTFSTGFALHERGADPAQTLGNADSALYAAKAAGRDRVCAFATRTREPMLELRLAPLDADPA
ncbi:MAG: sensor domain-containing diguanylate cyclase [Mycobacteriales bacterium]